jgi:hypothetical protein
LFIFAASELAHIGNYTTLAHHCINIAQAAAKPYSKGKQALIERHKFYVNSAMFSTGKRRLKVASLMVLDAQTSFSSMLEVVVSFLDFLALYLAAFSILLLFLRSFFSATILIASACDRFGCLACNSSTFLLILVIVIAFDLFSCF